METVTILRELWRRRRLVGVAALAAFFVGLLLTYTLSLPPQSRKYEVGIASARVLVDTPKSQVVDLAPRGSEALGARASLLSTLMIEGEVKAAIARRAGLRPRDLLTATESQPAALAAAGEPGKASDMYLLSTRIVTNASGEPLPIIEVEVQAPTAAQAGKLATATVTGLGAYLDSKAALERVSDARRLKVSGLGVPQVRTDVRGPRRVVALAAALFVFLAGCAAIVAFCALVRGWRAADEEEHRLQRGGLAGGGAGAILVGAVELQPADLGREAGVPPPERPKLLTPGGTRPR